MADIYRGSFGAKIEVTMNYDLTGQTGIKFIVKKPDASIVEWDATVEDYPKGIVSYLVKPNDLNLVGLYSLQPKVTFSGKLYYGDIVNFNVGELLQ